MADPAAVVKAPLGWAKGRPVVFGIFVLLVIVAAIRWRAEIVARTTALPVVGPFFTKLFGVGA
jgi:hypothetical protein